MDLDLSSAFQRPVSKTHPQRERFLRSRKRFSIIPAGRRSGKTFEARWRLIAGRFIEAALTMGA